MLFVDLISRLKASNASERSADDELSAKAVRLLPRWRLYTGGWSPRDEPVVHVSGGAGVVSAEPGTLVEADNALAPEVLLVGRL